MPRIDEVDPVCEFRAGHATVGKTAINEINCGQCVRPVIMDRQILTCWKKNKLWYTSTTHMHPDGYKYRPLFGT